MLLHFFSRFLVTHKILQFSSPTHNLGNPTTQSQKKSRIHTVKSQESEKKIHENLKSSLLDYTQSWYETRLFKWDQCTTFHTIESWIFMSIVIRIQIYFSMMSLHIWHFTSFTVAKPRSSFSVKVRVMMTSRSGSICFSIILFPSVNEKMFLTFRPSAVSCSEGSPGTNFCWWVLNGIYVLKQYSLSPVLINSDEHGICFAIFRLKKFMPKISNLIRICTVKSAPSQTHQ